MSTFCLFLILPFLPQLAQTVVDAGAIAHLAQMILNPDAKLKVNFGRRSILGIFFSEGKQSLACSLSCPPS